MKYLAILKDSLREAVDTKVFYATAILSIIIILVIASISFTPAPADEAISGIVGNSAFRVSYFDRGKSAIPMNARGLLDYEVVNVQALTQEADPSARDHVFTLNVAERAPFTFPLIVQSWHNKPDFEKLMPRDFRGGVGLITATDNEMAEFVKNQFMLAGNLDVSEINKTSVTEPDLKANPPKPGSYTFMVKTKGTAGVRGWPHDVNLVFGAVSLPSAMFQTSLGKSVHFIENLLIGGIGAWIAVLLGVVITSFFIPNMLRKGTIDMLLAKPIHRPTLLIYKYIGGLTFVFLNSAIAIGGIWLTLGLRSGIWAPGFLVMIFTLTLFFAILYSVSTLFAVLTRSPIVSILITCMAWFVLWVIGIGYQSLAGVQRDETLTALFKDNGWGWVFTASDVVHTVLPRTSDIDVIATKLVAQCLTEAEQRNLRLDLLPDVNWGESLFVSGMFIVVMLGLACMRFHFKDY